MNRNTFRIISILLILVNSLGALAGGAGLMNDPSGKGNQLALEWLKHTPFHDFFIPGLILFTVNGLFGLAVLAMIFFRHPRYPIFIVIQGILLGGWILIQMLMLPTIHLLQIIFMCIAMILVVLGLLQFRLRKPDPFNHE